MTTILIKDTLRQSVEAASGGVQTVLYTPKGQPSFMTIVPKKTLGDLYPRNYGGNTQVHPAFIIGGKTAPEILLGTYQGALSNGELVSQPYKPRARQVLYNTAFSAARANGPGHHAATWAERALIAGLCVGAKYNPWADNQFGISAVGHGVRVDGKAPGDSSAISDVYGGSGPVAYRHDNTFTGLSDVTAGYATLNGNSGLHQGYHGIRFFGGEVQVLPDNNAALVSDLLMYASGNRSADWRAIDGATGNLVAPTYTTNADGTVVATTPGTVRVIELGSMPKTGAGKSDVMPVNSFGALKEWTDFIPGNFSHNVSDAALAVLRTLSLYPTDDMLDTKGNPNRGTVNFAAVKGIVATSTMFCGFASVFGFALTGPTVLSGGSLLVRPAWYNPATLS